MSWTEGKHGVRIAALGVTLLVCAPRSVQADGTAFTFQGQIKREGVPLTDTMDVEASLWTAQDGGAQVGDFVFVDGVEVVGGLFSIQLDFGAAAFDGGERWLQLAVRSPSGTGAYTSLTPRQPVTPAPVALFAIEAANAGGDSNWVADGNDLYNTNIGNVGIGTTTPQAALDVRGTVLSQSPSGNNDNFQMQKTGDLGPSNARFVLSHRTNGTEAWMYASDGVNVFRNLQGWDYANNRVRFPATGSALVVDMDSDAVGIGTSSPTGRLHLVGPSPDIALKMEAGGSWTAELRQTDSSFLSLVNGGSERLTIAPDGNVGIGTTNPQHMLHLQSLGPTTIHLEADTNNAGEADQPRIIMSQDGGIITGGVGFFESSNSMSIRTFDTGVGTPHLLLEPEGNVGIGTTAPDNALHVHKGSAGTVTAHGNSPLVVENSTSAYVSVLTPSASESGILFGNPDHNTAGGVVYNNASTNNGLQFRTNGNVTRMVLDETGRAGIGTSSPQADLHVRGISPLGELIVTPNTSDSSAQIRLTENTTATLGAVMRYDGTTNQWQVLGWNQSGATEPHVVVGRDNGRVGIGTTSPTAQLHVNGTIRTNVLELAGADLAEEFPFSDAVEPGKVVMIDAHNPGRLTLARGAYTRRVAGIVAGANDFSSGVVLGRDSLPAGRHGGSGHGSPVALSGRVYVWCVTSNGPIEPGDMLTTSDAPGYAMKVTDFARAQGAILGKAMTSLADGPGLVLVLVSLQ